MIKLFLSLLLAAALGIQQTPQDNGEWSTRSTEWVETERGVVIALFLDKEDQPLYMVGLCAATAEYIERSKTIPCWSSIPFPTPEELK
jgi:hypothetical protein